MNKFLLFLGAFLIWVASCFFITGCALTDQGAVYKKAIGGIKEKKDVVLKELEAGKIDVKTALALIKDLDELKNRVNEKSKGEGRNWLLEIGLLLSAILGGNRWRDKIPGATRKDYVHKING